MQVQQASFTVDDVRKRSRKLLEEIKQLETSEANKKQLKYHAPLSKAVQIEEMFFECKNGRVAYIDLPAFMEQVNVSLDDISRELRTSFRVERTTTSVGAFKLRYAIERERTVMDAGGASTVGGFRYGLTEWNVEPSRSTGGETWRKPRSSLTSRLVDALDPQSDGRHVLGHPDS